MSCVGSLYCGYIRGCSMVRRYMLKNLRVKYHKVCKLLSINSAKVNMRGGRTDEYKCGKNVAADKYR